MTEPTTQVENYLKVIWNAGEWSRDPVTVGGLAQKLGLAPSSVSEAVRKLVGSELVTHPPYGAIELTDSGRAIALAMVRKHRLIETFLVRHLGYDWDEVHDEAEVLEHGVSERFVDRLETLLGHPDRDPHGDPIPRSDGSLPELPDLPLTEVPGGAAVRIARVSDADPALLRHLTAIGIELDVPLRVIEQHTVAGTIEVEIGGGRTQLGLRAADAIRAVPA